MAGKIYVARQNGVIGTDDGPVRIRAGVTRVREGHALLQGNEHLFEEQHVHYDTEDATDRPADGSRSALDGDELAKHQQRGGAERRTKRHDEPGLTPDGDKAEEDPIDLREQNPQLADEQENAEEAQRVSAERDIPLPSGDNDTAAGNADADLEQTDAEKAQEDKAREEAEDFQRQEAEANEADQENAEAAAKVAAKPTPRPRRGPRKPPNPGLTSGDPSTPTN